MKRQVNTFIKAAQKTSNGLTILKIRERSTDPRLLSQLLHPIYSQ